MWPTRIFLSANRRSRLHHFSTEKGRFREIVKYLPFHSEGLLTALHGITRSAVQLQRVIGNLYGRLCRQNLGLRRLVNQPPRRGIFSNSLIRAVWIQPRNPVAITNFSELSLREAGGFTCDTLSNRCLRIFCNSPSAPPASTLETNVPPSSNMSNAR